MSGIGLISNPYSRKNRKHPDRLQQLIDCAPQKELVRLPDSYAKMDEAIQHFKDSEIDILAVNGGDGTVHVALSALIKIYNGKPLPKLAVLKGGTINETATNLRIKGDTISIFKRVVKAYQKKPDNLKIHKVSLLKINDKYGFIFGNAAICSFMEIYHRSSEPSPLGAAKAVATLLGSIVVRNKIYKKVFTPINQELIVDNFSFGKAPYLAVLISTLPEIGLGFEVMHRAKLDYKKAQMIAFQDKIKIIAQVPRAWLGFSIPSDMVDDSVGNRFVINSEEPFKYTLDGDFYSSVGNLIIETGPIMEVIVE